MREDADTAWEWVVCGRYGYYAVDKYIKGDTSHSTYGESIILRTRKDATKVANALNAAHNAGIAYGRKRGPINVESVETTNR